MEKPVKVICLGPPETSLKAFFKRLEKLQNQHHFDVCIVPDLFGKVSPDEDLEGATAAVDVYTTARAPVEIPRVHAMPGNGVVSLANGMRLGYIGSPKGELKGEVDVLISRLLPEKALQLSAKTVPAPVLKGAAHSAAVDASVAQSKAKYLFVASSVFFEREPFQWDPDAPASCRVISLAGVGNKQKERFFYAFELRNSDQLPAHVTPNPFAPRKRAGNSLIFGDGKRTKRDAPPDGYVCKVCSEKGHWIQDCPEKAAQPRNARPVPEGYVCKACGEPGHWIGECPAISQRRAEPGKAGPPQSYTCKICDKKGHWIQECPNKTESGSRGTKTIDVDHCWFCLSNPRLAKHLIVDIGEEIYVALPKGALIESGPVPGGGHVLLIPITHIAAIATAPADVAQNIADEIRATKHKLQTLYAAYGCSLVAWETHLTGLQGHLNVQVCPVPASVSPESILTVFKYEATKQGLKMVEGAPTSESYFTVDINDKTYSFDVANTRFSLQFGRQVLATILETPQRTDWRACVFTEDEEAAAAEAFKAIYTVDQDEEGEDEEAKAEAV